MLIGLFTGIAVVSLAACGSSASPTSSANTPEAILAPTDTALAASVAGTDTAAPAVTDTAAAAPATETAGAAFTATSTTANSPTATSSGDTTPEATEEAAKPSNKGGPGPAVDLTGDPQAGQKVFAANCQQCHGPEGKGGVANAGSDDGTVPPLNPIDDTIANKDPKVFAKNVDLFLEHGSTPEGTKPALVMPAWGDQKLLTPQQIADVLAYIISLNQPK